MPRHNDDEYDDYEERRPRRSRSRRNAGDYSGFVKTFIIMDLIFCGLRVLLVLAAIGRMSSPDLGPLKPTVIYEIGTGITLALLGLIANGLLLARNQMGVLFGWMALAATAGSILVGLWQTSIMIGIAPADSAYKSGMIIGAGMAMIVRIGLNIGYAAALAKVPEELD